VQKPRDLKGKKNNKQKGQKEKSKTQPINDRDKKLLSFGDDEDEDAMTFQKAKIKSSHDVLNDSKLSKEAVVDVNKLELKKSVSPSVPLSNKKAAKKEQEKKRKYTESDDDDDDEIFNSTVDEDKLKRTEADKFVTTTNPQIKTTARNPENETRNKINSS
jgi:hypothetical protein